MFYWGIYTKYIAYIIVLNSLNKLSRIPQEILQLRAIWLALYRWILIDRPIVALWRTISKNCTQKLDHDQIRKYVPLCASLVCTFQTVIMMIGWEFGKCSILTFQWIISSLHFFLNELVHVQSFLFEPGGIKLRSNIHLCKKLSEEEICTGNGSSILISEIGPGSLV